MNKNRLLIYIVIICTSLFLSISIIFNALCNRYYIDTITKFKVDKLTGNTYKLLYNKWTKIPNDSLLDKTEMDTKHRLDNIKQIRNSQTLSLSFKNYFNKILKNITNTPTYYDSKDPDYLNMFIDYSPDLSPKKIAEIHKENHINNYDGFLQYLIQIYNEQIEFEEDN